MKLFLQGRYTIIEECFFSEDDDVISFNVPIEGAPSVEIKIFTKDKFMEANQEVDVDQHFLELLEVESLKHEKSFDDDISVFTENSKHLGFAVNKAIYAIRFFFNWRGLDKNLISSKGVYWSIDNENWTIYPTRLIAYMSSYSYTTLSKDSSTYIQAYLDGQLWEPFMAFQFLDKAKGESNPTFKWINATIAAELAIKEFFIRYDSKFEQFIMEVPSPPLHKLYGSILESMVGEKSPVLKAIQKGIEIRNKLVHRPNTEKVDLDTANQYVEDIEFAMFHLLSKLYSKDDPIINERINPRIKFLRK
ncbi:hypothetical protein [Neobacillus drentensis]|uniref:hypothetical protein n=1 Tax=Neobacillus drentensis TaxID=220684 RepID=UPI0028591B07|nr:hypothetical protein [Neobacillus drentensis]MDR7240485.1 hypothetical protein [Neobacillus drentensis]